jgi:lambda family phage tail tape measure protein
MLAVKPDKVLKQWEDYNRILKEGTASADKLATAQRRLNQLSGAPRILERRRVSESAAITQDPEYLRRFGFEGASLPELPNTNAAYAQQIKELQQDLANLDRNSIEYLQTLMQLTGVQRQSTEVARGYAQALLMGVQTKTVANSTRNLQEVVTALRAEMQQLDTTTSEGSAAYAQNANQVRVLEKQLNDLAGAYRNVSTMATQAATAEQNAANARIRDNYFNRGMVRQQEAALAELGQRVRAGVSGTPLLLPAAGQTSARGTGLEISAGEGVRVRRGRRSTSTSSTGEVSALGQQAGLGGVERFFGAASLGSATGVPIGPVMTSDQEKKNRTRVITEAAQAYDTLGKSVERSRRPLRDIYVDIDKTTKASNGSVNSLEAQIGVWTELRNAVGRTAPAFDTASKKLEQLTAQRERITGGRRLSGMQLAQGVGAALSGGIFGGPEGLIGGLGGLAVGGVGGAFAGAAFGAQVGMVRQQIGVFTEQAAAISKLRIGLASVSTDLREFEASTRAVEGASQSLLIPLADTYRYYTQLRASTVELNYSANDTRQILEGTASAVLKTGGSLADVDGAMRAVVQILSKGKAAAEEVRGQLGERFPGAVIKFAQANRMSVQELDQAFQAGSVTIEQFITFARKNYKDGGKYVETLADSTEYAGRRMEKALENLRLAVGRSLKESGAGFQNFAAEAAESLLWLGQQLYAFGDAAERALGGTPGPTGNAKEIAERIIGGGTTVAAVEEAIRTYEGKVQEAKDRLNAVKTRNIFQFIFDETFGQGTPTQQQTGKTVSSFESRIQSLREALKLADDYTRRGKRGAGSGSEDPAAADRAKSLLSAIEQREEALAQARIQREEQLADIRKQAVEQVRQLERQFADERLTAERAIARNRRELSDLQAAAQLSFRAETEQNPYLVDAERGISEILRKSREDRIRIDEEYNDKQTQRARLLADFQKKVADDINKANEAYAKQIGNIQREYAKNVARIVEEGTKAASKRLETAGKLAGLYMQRAVLNATLAAGTGLVAVEPGTQTETTWTAEELLTSSRTAIANYKLSLSNIAGIDTQIQALQGRLQQLKPLVPSAPTTSPMRSLPMSKQFDIPGTAALNRSTAEQRGTEERLVTEQEAAAIRDRFTSITEESNKQVQNLQEQNVLLNLQAKYLNTGVNTELARQFAQEELNYTKRRARLDAERQEAIRQGLDVKAINALYEGRLSVLNDQYSVLMRQTEELDKQQRLLRLRQDDRIGLGIREGAQKYVESIGTMREATAQLAQTGIKGVEDAIFSLVTTGTANFREFAASILKDTARMIIQQLILRSVMQIIGAVAPGGGSFGKGYFDPITGKGAAGPNFGFAMGGAFAKNGIVPFAMGGIVNKPTLFKFANGGAGRLGLMGEAGPEAIMPLRRLPNGRLGVEQAGGGTPVTVNVSVDASGTAVQGDAGQGEQLGRVVAQAVQAELIKQRRPGGLLNR